MDERRTHKPLSGDRRQNDATGTHTVRDGDLSAETMPPSVPSARLASELFARLLLELPAHRRELRSARRDGDEKRLGRAAHKLLGAVVYCDLPELAGVLRELRQMTESGDATRTGPALEAVLRRIDELLACIGYRET
jgi:HPt (histidine-containing phosphotransfer) domain-containing protein